MGTIASQLTSLTIVYSTVYSGADQGKHESSASLAFVWGSHRWPVNSPHKGPATRKMFPFDDVIMRILCFLWNPITNQCLIFIYIVLLRYRQIGELRTLFEFACSLYLTCNMVLDMDGSISRVLLCIMIFSILRSYGTEFSINQMGTYCWPKLHSHLR